MLFDVRDFIFLSISEKSYEIEPLTYGHVKRHNLTFFKNNLSFHSPLEVYQRFVQILLKFFILSNFLRGCSDGNFGRK